MLRINDTEKCASFWYAPKERVGDILYNAGRSFATYLNAKMGTPGRVVVASDVRDINHIARGFVNNVRGNASYAPFWFNGIQYYTSAIGVRRADTLVVVAPMIITAFTVSIMVRVAVERCIPKKIIIFTVAANAMLDTIIRRFLPKGMMRSVEIYYIETVSARDEYDESLWRDDEDMKHIPDCIK